MQKQPADRANDQDILGVRYQRLLRLIPGAYFEMDPGGRILYVNDEITEISGYCREELVGQNWWSLFHPHQTAQQVQELQTRLARSGVGKLTLSITTKCGNISSLDLTTANEYDENGALSLIAGLAVHCKDPIRERENEEQLQGILESVRGHAIYKLDTEGNVTSWNAGAELIKGYTADEIVGQHFSCFFLNKQFRGDTPEKILQKAARQGKYEGEGWQVRKDGSSYWANVVISPMYNRDGSLLGFVKVVRDMTNRKKAEERLRKQTEYIRLLQDIASAANEASRVQDAMEYAVHRICKHSGWNIGHAIRVVDKPTVTLESMKIWYLSDPYLFDGFRTASETTRFYPGIGLLGKAYSTAGPVWMTRVGEDQSYTRNSLAKENGIATGAAFPVMVGRQVAGVLEFYSQKETEPDEQLLQVMVQIGTQLGRVIERKQSEEALRLSEARFRTIINGAPLGIELVDLDGRLLEYNTALAEMLGYTPEELQTLDMEKTNHPAYLVVDTPFFDDLRLGKRNTFRIEKPYVQKDGRQSWGRLSVSLVRNARGDPQYAIGMLEDITERKQMEAELAELQRSLMEGRETERLQLAREIHDGPVQELYGLTFQMKAISEKLNDDEKRELHELQNLFTRVIVTLRAICKDLRPPTLAPFGLEKAIRSHADEFIKENPVEIDLDLMPDGQTLPHKTRMGLFRIYQQSLTNAVRNARAKKIRVKFHFNPREIHFELENDGIGFAVPDRLVELARQGHLELISAAERAEAIGGKFEIESEPGRGMKIKVVVPQYKSRSSE